MAKKKYYQRPDGMFEVSRRINGKRVVFRGKSCREVDQKILEYHEEKEQAKRGRKFPVVADEWARQHERDITEATRQAYSYPVIRLKEAFPGPIAEIRPMHLTKYIRDLEAKGYSGKTVGIEISVCKQIFAHAIEMGDIEISPASVLRRSKNLPYKAREALTEEQEAVVKQSGKDRTAPFWLFPYLLLHTGLRRGEALALSYSDIDRKAGVIHINKKITYVRGNTPILEHHLKSENGLRDVPLLQPLADVLPKNRIGLIFPGEAGGFMTAWEIKKYWRAYCRAVGFMNSQKVKKKINGKQVERTVEDFPITPHCFRHSFATICYEAGLDIRQTARILGDSVQTVEEIYTHLRERHAHHGTEKLEDYCVISV